MTMELLIVCPECSSARVSKAIDREAPLNWNEQDKIQLLTVPDRRSGDSPFVTGRILKHLSRQSNLTSIIAIDAKIELNKLIGRAIVQTPPGILVFERRVLPQTLKALKLDWLSEMDYKLRNGWHHGAIDRQYLEKWTKQFERLGGHGWVASGLLKVLDFWSDTRIREALRIEETGLSAFDCVAVNRHKRAGKSADAIASLVQKQLDSGNFGRILGRVLDLRTAIQSDDFNRILFVEDCLITGNEMSRVFTALLGQEDQFGESKADPLDTPELLRKKQIVLRFAVVTNGGVAHIEQFLRKEGLHNITVDLTGENILATLTPGGLNDLENNTLYDSDQCLMDAVRQVIKTCFIPIAVWGSEKKAGRAMEFCATVGRQLYKLYVEKRSKATSEKMLDESALGIRSLALALAFSHSVPKETLPPFWMKGRVSFGGKGIEWQPLFQGGE